ncbi:MAG TPA: glycoside hydrolase domain-containing protein [Vicinamibacterales bacterium]|nr:glycoside hydrolase domain-containing protein [Vicinamibacterales bacterium]
MIKPRHTLLLLALATGCARVATTVARPVTQTFAGFDVSIYPGDAAMRAWARPNSPYHWVGYYLPAPCHRDASWAGRRETLTAMGWGLAVIYVGQQTWDGVPERAATPDTAGAAVQRSIVCSRTLLSAAQGLSEANDAIAKAAADGFPRGTQIFLDIERMTTIPQSMRDYYRAWVTRVLADGQFRPAIYAHQRNAAEIYADVRAAFDAAGVRHEPSFWVSSPGTVTAASVPSEVGLQFARVWQHTIDVSQTHNAVTLRRIDANIADSPSPSAPGPNVVSTGQGGVTRAP